MSDRKPIVLAPDPTNPSDTVLQQLQRSDELDIPLEVRHRRLKKRFDVLVFFLVGLGFDIPPELTEDL